MSFLVLPGGLVAWSQAPAGEEAGLLRARWSSLSGAELEVAVLAVDGLSNQEIATRRQVRPRTVANLLASAYRKLGVTGRVELAARFGGWARPVAPGAQ